MLKKMSINPHTAAQTAITGFCSLTFASLKGEMLDSWATWLNCLTSENSSELV